MNRSVEERPTDTQENTLPVDVVIGYLKAHKEDRDTGKPGKELGDLLQSLHSAEISSLLESMPHDFRQQLWSLLPQGLEGEVLSHLGDQARNSILGHMDNAAVVAATETINTESLADFIDDLPVDISEAVIESLSSDRKQRLQATLAYEEGSAGRLMNTDVISVRKDVSIAVVLRYLRKLKPLPAHMDAVMVTDENGVYQGKLNLADALSEHPSTIVGDVMLVMADMISVNASEHDISVLFGRRDLLSAAVVNENNQLLGRITVDNAVDIMMAEADKAILASAGLNEDEGLFAPVLSSAKRRAIWLGINLITVFLAAWVIGQFEEALDKIVALAVLMPVVASMGGIAGSQTLTLTIRGLALGQVSASNLRWLGSKELAVGMLNGVTWAVVVSLVTFVWFENTGISLIIGVAMLINLLAAAFSGVLIPVVLDRMKIDPALSGAVILTTVTDVIGFLSFLGLASLFLI